MWKMKISGLDYIKCKFRNGNLKAQIGGVGTGKMKVTGGYCRKFNHLRVGPF